MSKIKAALDALKTVSIVCGMVPLVGENLKSAVELASTICEHIQSMEESQEGYQRIGVQVAELLTAVASVLQQPNQYAALMGTMQNNTECLMNVLKEIEAAVLERLPSDPGPVHKRARLADSIRRKATDLKRRYKDPQELEELRRKLQNVVDSFTVSSLLRNELNSLRSQLDVNAVHVLATRVLERQAQEAGRAQQTAEQAQRTAERAQRVADIAMLDSLRPITSAAWNAPGAQDAQSLPISTCTPGTRVSLLEDLMTWATGSDSPCLFWLNGLAGTGKSTIARTLCERLNEHGVLGASFFISRDQSDRREASNIVRSIAYQLAVRSRPVSEALCANLRETPVLAARSLQEQITDWIIIPARELPGNAPFIIVIDALDEAFADFLGRPGGSLLLLLGRQLLQLAGRVKLFITSRNEVPIQQMFHEISVVSKTAVKLHDLDSAVVQADITTYLTHSFANIRETRLELSLGDWPTSITVHELATLSGLLFIYAATAVRFVSHRRHSPRERLVQLLRHTSGAGTSPYRQLDGLYRQILDDAVQDSDDNQNSLCERLQAVIAVIVLAYTPLNIEALATLSGVSLDGVNLVVASLSSLLADSTSGVRVFHPSFPDFAFDASRIRDPRLCVVPTVKHGLIALRCLEIMNKNLHYDICNIQDTTLANKEIQNLDEALRENVSDALRYAACFWCHHLTASGAPGSLLIELFAEFCEKHLFHWVEVLSLVEHVIPVETALLGAIEWCDKHPSNTTSRLTSLLRDLTQALRIYAIPIRSHALHAYHSAFVTMPRCELLETLQKDLPSGLPRLVSPRAAHWGPSPRVLEGHIGGVNAVAFSPDGTYIVSGSSDGTVHVWNAVTFEQLAELKGHEAKVWSVAISPDGTHIVSGSHDRTVRVWNAVTFEQLAVLKGHDEGVLSVSFSPDGTHIVSGSIDSTVRVWRAVTFEQLAELKGHRGEVNSVAFSPDGTHIVSGSYDRTVRVWNAVTFEQMAELQGHEASVYSVAFSPEGTCIVSGSGDCTVRVWNAVTYEQMAELSGHEGGAYSVAFSPDGTQIAAGSEWRTVHIWNAAAFEQLAELKGHENQVLSVVFSPDGTYIVSGSSDSTVRVWNAVASEQLAELMGHEDIVNSVAFSPDGTLIVSGSYDQTVRVWNAVTFEPLAELKGHEDSVNSVAFSPDGTHIVSGSDDHTVCVWNAVTFWQLAELEGHEGEVNSVAFSSDCTHIVSGSNDRTVRVWDAITFEQMAELKGHEGSVESVAFSPDGIHIVSGSSDRTLRVWNAVTSEQLAELKGHEGWVESVAVSPDGSLIHSRSGKRELAWIRTNDHLTAWAKIPPIELSSGIASIASISKINVAISDSGWLSCSYAARRILLWLPTERRGEEFASYGSRVVVGALAGAVTVLELPMEPA